MLPEGPTDSIYWISDKGTRVELMKASAIMPAGSVLLNLVDGTTVVMNPKDKTYWKLSVPQTLPQMAGILSQMNPQRSDIRTGEFATIAGVRAEHLTSSTTMDLPAPPPGIPMPPGMPTSITISTDSWMAEQYSDYAAVARTAATMMGLDALIPQGFMLKSVMRNSMTPGYEIESTVTEIREEPAPADAFEIPTDYNEVPPLIPARPGLAASVQREGAARPTPLPPGVYRAGNGVTVPHLIKQVFPQYTASAMRAKIQGTVLLEGIVQTDGSVSDLKVLRSVDSTYGLDDQAMKAASQWQFSPGRKENQPVPVMVTIEVAFTLKN
jgi:TonB family protein